MNEATAAHYMPATIYFENRISLPRGRSGPKKFLPLPTQLIEIKFIAKVG
jgi:hypothetical protein